MAKQEVVTFRPGVYPDNLDVDTQLANYLKDHPDQAVRAMAIDNSGRLIAVCDIDPDYVSPKDRAEIVHFDTGNKK